MTDTPKKRGRPPKKATVSKTVAETQTAATADLSRFPVSQVTAHRPVALLEVQDSADLDVLMLDNKVSSHILTRLSPTFALLTTGSEKTVLDALRKAGHTPKVQEYGGQKGGA